jgi:hypothetical protein
MDMIMYLLDCAEAKLPADEIPASEELAEMFGLKFRWVTSIGFAVRNDVKYPEDMSAYGTREAERKFNYFTQKYSLIKEFMGNFELIENLYGPGTTWYIRKSLTYQSPVVSGPGWLAVGDACGFTNPLYSPGITATMSTSTYAAELTHQALEVAKSAPDADAAELSVRKMFAPYDDFARRLIPALNQMNRFQYVSFRAPILGTRLSALWQFFAGIEVGFPKLTVETYASNSIKWAWGSMLPEYETVARKVIETIAPIPLEESVPDATVRELIEFSDGILRAAFDSAPTDSDRFGFRWDSFLRYYDRSLNYSEEFSPGDHYCRQCPGCGSWFALHPGWRKCYTCGHKRTAEESAIIYNPALTEDELNKLRKIRQMPSSA